MTLKGWLLSTLCCAALLSCTKKGEEPVKTDNAVKVSATAESYTLKGAGNSQVLWSQGDRVYLFAGDGTKGVLNIRSGAGTASAEFEGSIKSATAPFVAFSPAKGARSLADGKLGFSLPQTQDGTNPSAALLGGLTSSTTFINICGILRFSLKGSGTIFRVKLESLDTSDMLWGDGTLSVDASSGVETWAMEIRNGDNASYMDIPGGLVLSSGSSEVSFILPAGTLKKGFRLSLYDNSDNLIDEKEVTVNRCVERGVIDAEAFSSVATYREVSIPGTLIRTSTADPCLLYRDGEFYLTMTGTSRIAMIHDSDLGSLTTAKHSSGSNIIYDSASDPNVAALYGTGATINGTWSPEIHILSDKDCPGYAGCYIFFALKQNTGDARNVRPVIMKSSSGSIAGPYVHPTTGVKNSSQTLLDKNGSPISVWNIGMSLLKIPTGDFKGLYGTFVDEVGRGEGQGKFYQRIRIAKMKSPWQLASDIFTVTTPTQSWEKYGSDNTLPEVVEGGTAVYGDNGEIFLAYCGSGYWSDYGLGQLTLKRENGDYCNPLLSTSWLKYDRNPLFSARESSDLRGAGHAFFLMDDRGNRFMTYHAYPWDGTTKASSRNAYIEPYTIDYTARSANAPDGVIMFGAKKNGKTAPVNTPVTFWARER